MSKILARLTAGSPDWRTPRGGSGRGISSSDVAAAMGAIADRVQYHLLMTRGADQPPNEGELELVLQEIQNIAVRAWLKGRGRNRMDRGKVRPIAETAWIEVAQRPLTHTERLNEIGCSNGAWGTSYKYVYWEVIRELESMYSDGCVAVLRRLGFF